MELKAISFDFWNTLAVDREPVRVRETSAQEMVAELKGAGIEIGRENMLEAFLECRQLCYTYQEDKGIDYTPKEQLDWILAYFDIDVTPQRWNRLFNQYTTSVLDTPPKFVEDLNIVLKQLKSEYVLAIICNTGRTPGWVLRSILKESKLDAYFTAQVFSNEVGVAKPNPYIFEITARMLGAKPHEVLHIGDSLHTDVYGASMAGFKAAWYNPQGLKKEVKCDLVLNDFRDVVKLM